jgi:hypothetical protein
MFLFVMMEFPAATILALDRELQPSLQDGVCVATSRQGQAFFKLTLSLKGFQPCQKTRSLLFTAIFIMQLI